jgi:nucleotide-binding universal stress UspA family protein
MFRSILVPTDGTALSRRAIERAARLAKEQKARLAGFWVGPTWQPNLYACSRDVPSGVTSPARFSADVRKRATRYLDVIRRAAAAAGVPCYCWYVRGNFPYLEIINAARRQRCDLIVMASHGRRGGSRRLLGSETIKVLACSTLPVMVCR